jgi:hypothetical protein
MRERQEAIEGGGPVMKSEDERRQDYVIGLVNHINSVLNGENVAEAQTALTIAVACQIVATTEDKDQVVQMAHGFARQLDEFVRREDIVEWIKYSTTHFTGTGRKQ